MNLENAISVGLSVEANPRTAIRTDFPAAIRLLIEAGKRVKVARLRKEPAWGSLLPGETED